MAFEEHKERFVSFIQKRLTVKVDAEDIVQEILYQFFRRKYLKRQIFQLIHCFQENIMQ